MIRSILQRASLLSIAILFLLIAPLASAQSQTEETAQTEEATQTEQAADTIPTAELEAVAATLAKVQKVREKYRKKIQRAKSPEKARTYRRKMVLQVDWTIEEIKGISVKRYKEITRAAERDDELRQKLLALTKQQRSTKDRSRGER